MFDDVDNRLEKWVQGILGEIDVSFEAPGGSQTSRVVGVYLIEVLQVPQGVGGSRKPPLKFELRYLITTWSPQPKEAHRALGQILVAACESAEFEVDLEALPPMFWTAFQTPPRPGFVIRYPVFHEVAEEKAPPVTEPPALSTSPVEILAGRVLGPGDVPLAGARVELAELNLRATTNSSGEFSLGAVPSNPRPTRILVIVKGIRITKNMDNILAKDGEIEIGLTAKDLQS